MLVEDDDVSQLLIKELLDDAGIALICESHGLKGLQKFKKIHNSLEMVILDIRLPDTDGIRIQNLMRIIRPEIPIIAFTALDAEVRRRCFDEGFNDVLEKPLNYQRFSEVLEAYL